jgi:hypothetical protein
MKLGKSPQESAPNKGMKMKFLKYDTSLKMNIILILEDVAMWFRKIPMRIAFILPPKIALWCFTRVVAIRGDAPDWYKETYDAWVVKHKISRM